MEKINIKNFIPCNPNALEEVKAVLKYLSDISGEGIITGQHTQTTVQEELLYIKEVTGKQPALCGFELLSYSPNNMASFPRIRRNLVLVEQQGQSGCKRIISSDV